MTHPQDNSAQNPLNDRRRAWARNRGLVLVGHNRPEKILGQRRVPSIARWMDHPHLWRPSKADASRPRGVRGRPTLFTCAPYQLSKFGEHSDDERAEIARFCARLGFEFRIYEPEEARSAGFYGLGTLHIEIWAPAPAKGA